MNKINFILLLVSLLIEVNWNWIEEIWGEEYIEEKREVFKW